MQRTLLLILFLFFTVQLYKTAGQTPVIESLKAIIKTTPDNEKLVNIVELSEQSVDPDSLLPYVIIAETIAASTKNISDDHLAAYSRASYYVRKNMTDSALTIVESLLTEYKTDKGQQPFYLKILFFKAKIFDRANQYSKALAQLSEVIQTAETLKDTLIQIQAKTGIGWVQMEMGQFKESLQWLYKALHTSTNKKYYKNYGALYSNFASAYNSLGNSDSAVYYITIAIKDARENNNLNFLATALSMQAKIFIDSKQRHLAEAPLNEALEIRKKLNDPFYIVYDMSSLASYYAANNQTEKGIELCKEGIVLSKQSGLTSQLLMMYNALAENYKAAGNSAEYGKTLEAIIAIKDSFNTINSARLLSDIQANNESQKKEKQIIEQKLALAKKNYWLYGSALFIVMAAIIGWLAFNNYRRRQRLKMHLALEEEKRLSAQAVIDAEEQERKRIAADLHDNLGTYAASIASNLDHLSVEDVNMNNAVPLQELRNNSQAIVSQLGDTIWALKKDALSLTAISDRLKVFIQRIQPSYPDITIDVMEKIITDHLLPPSQAFHLFQISQEATINALKHSDGKNIILLIEGNGHWTISIRDNGKGMTGNAINSSGGNGLINMQNRARENGWIINWLQNEQGGTSVTIATTTN
jgi:signal transduction histidine kinase/tetratricopeptide (TPR) repeat protein